MTKVGFTYRILMYPCAWNKKGKMFVYEAASLLKNIVCPHCRQGVRGSMDCPFDLFNTVVLNNHCATKECTDFYNNIKVQFLSYEKGTIDLSELHSWLDYFRAENI